MADDFKLTALQSFISSNIEGFEGFDNIDWVINEEGRKNKFLSHHFKFKYRGTYFYFMQRNNLANDLKQNELLHYVSEVINNFNNSQATLSNFFCEFKKEQLNGKLSFDKDFRVLLSHGLIDEMCPEVNNIACCDYEDFLKKLDNNIFKLQRIRA